MHILVTNDDGYSADGIAALTAVAREFGELTVVAPRRDHSGASSSLTLTGDIKICQHGERHFIVDGTPTDCVHLALTGGFFVSPPDLIVSGINSGANMGDDTVYSGTVAAAMEGHLFNIPAFAFSMAAKPTQHFDAGAEAARQLLARFCASPPPGAPLFNVNIPDVPPAQLRGIELTRLGRRHPAEAAICKSRTDSEMIYTIGAAGPAKDDGEGTDFYAVDNNRISLTPLTADLTAYRRMDDAQEWLSR